MTEPSVYQSSYPVRDVAALMSSVDVVVLSADLYISDAGLAAASAVLSADEHARRNRMQNAVVARRFTASRAILRSILADAVSVKANEVSITYGAHGKPDLAAPHQHLGFSIAHSGDMLLVAVSRSAEIGVDVERLRPIENWEAIAKRILSASEMDGLLNEVAQSPRDDRWFLRRWCRLEASLKVHGGGFTGLSRHRETASRPNVRVADLGELGTAETGAQYVAAVALAC